jgi:hypothetical protein
MQETWRYGGSGELFAGLTWSNRPNMAKGRAASLGSNVTGYWSPRFWHVASSTALTANGRRNSYLQRGMLY